MPVLTKLITGVHVTSESATLFIEGTPSDPAPALQVLQRGNTTPVAVYYDGGKGGWTAELEDTDYMLTMTMDDEDWFTGTLEITAQGESSVAFVFHGPETEEPNEHLTFAWSASTALVGSDPKDPWPPPGQDEFDLPSTSKTWFHTTLHAARVGLPTPKAA